MKKGRGISFALPFISYRHASVFVFLILSQEDQDDDDDDGSSSSYSIASLCRYIAFAKKLFTRIPYEHNGIRCIVITQGNRVHLHTLPYRQEPFPYRWYNYLHKVESLGFASALHLRRFLLLCIFSFKSFTTRSELLFHLRCIIR